jgi:hypothetical protein
MSNSDAGELCADLLPPGVLNIIADDSDLGAELTPAWCARSNSARVLP